MLKRIVFALFFCSCSLCKPSLSALKEKNFGIRRAQEKMILLHIRTSEFFSILNKYFPVSSKALSTQKYAFCGDSSFPRQVSFRFPFLRESDLPWFRSIRCPASAKVLLSLVMAFLPFGRCRLCLFPDYEFSFYKKRKQRNP